MLLDTEQALAQAEEPSSTRLNSSTNNTFASKHGVTLRESS